MTAFCNFLAVLLVVSMLAGCSRSEGNMQSEPIRTVTVIHPQRGDVVSSISLPGDLVGLYESTLYSKVTGYLKSIVVDKGDWVKEGQTLALIEVPELDQRVARAKASLEVERLTYQRLEQVWKSDPRLVAKQDVDIAQGKYLEAKANLDELEALVSYTRIVAPFDGIITGRFVDPGALIKAGGDQTTSTPEEGSAHPTGPTTPLLSLAMIDPMRIYVYAPQGVVGFIRRGMPAKVALQDLPGRSFDGSVTRFAASLDLSTRTMLTEIDLQNSHHELYPGMYANVRLELERHHNALEIPNAAVGDSPEGNYVMVALRGRLRRRRVAVGIGTERYTEIIRGLTGSEQVVAALDPSLTEGEPVQAVIKDSASSEAANAVFMK
jgi:membrane fusion protein, multidrug efflux system